jgi:16S rRNA (adenine1518-N6/adenine1519-N6)-dimethyltransferase
LYRIAELFHREAADRFDPRKGDPMTSVRQMLAHYDIRPQKRLGQSFLEDMNTVRRIVELAEPREDETVVEIGAGLGFMTELLAMKAARVIAIEVDPRLTAILHDRFAGHDRVTIVHQDVLTYDFASACPGERIKVVGNIPYHISTPILFRLLDHRRAISSLLLMFQKELADRIVAGPGTKAYGIPSVLVTRYTKAACVLSVPPTCFYPVPEVSSAVVRMEIRREFDPPDQTLFARVVRAAFAQRRKTLWNNIRGTGLPEEMAEKVFTESGIDRTRRAETLSVDEFSRLTKSWGEIGADKILDNPRAV